MAEQQEAADKGKVSQEEQQSGAVEPAAGLEKPSSGASVADALGPAAEEAALHDEQQHNFALAKDGKVVALPIRWCVHWQRPSVIHRLVMPPRPFSLQAAKSWL
jgi:hypothetical protein